MRALEEAALDISFALDKLESEAAREHSAAVIRENEAKFRRLFENMIEGFAYCQMVFENGQPSDFIYLDVNPAFEALTGLRNAVGKRVTEVIPGIRESDPELFEIYGRVASGGKPERFEMFVQALGEWYSVSVYSPANGHFVAVFDVITQRKEAEEALRESEAKFSKTFWNAPVMMAITTLKEGAVVEVNRGFHSALGYQRDDLIGKTLASAGVLTAEERRRILSALLSGGQAANLEITLHRKDGQAVACEYAGQLISIGGRACILSAIIDLTDRKQQEAERETMLNLLRLLNAPNDLEGLIREATAMFHEWSGCEAVGIRLRDGEDYPYFETRGFPPEFVEAETRLCARDLNGQVRRDSQGNPVMECMCGNVLCGRFDPRQPFFTANGSFWTNSTSGLLASTREADCLGRTRNGCNGEGYESVALVPLRAGGLTLGLLQCNDRRPGRFTPAMIGLLERAAGSLAIALEQRKTLEALRASRERYRLVADHTYDWEFWIAPDGTPQYHSPSCERITGHSAREFLGDPELFDKIIHPDDREAFGRHVAEAARREAGSLEFRMRTRQGEEVTIEHVCQPVYGEDGNYLGRRGSNRDITERKRADQALRESERRYRLISENADDMIWTVDLAAMRVTYISPSVLRARGYSAEEIVGRPVESALTPESFRRIMDELPGRLAAFEAGDESGRVWTTEVDYPRKDGSVASTEVVATFVADEHGVPREVVGVARDISRRKRAERELSENRALLHSIIEGTPDAIYAKDLQGHYTMFNRAAGRDTGKDPGEVLGQDDTFLFPPAEAAEIMANDRWVIEEGTTITFEGPLTTAGGETRTFISAKGVLRNADGEAMGLFGVARDITERKKAEEQRAKLQMQLLQAQKMESVGRLAGGVAHDFNNLLTVINGYSDLMLRRLDTHDPFHASLTEIRKAGGRAADLTRQLLAFSRKQVIEPKPLDLNQLISASRDMLSRLIGENVEVAIHLAPNLGYVFADSGQLHQVVMNLVVNARDAMPEGGRLTIETARAGRDYANLPPDAVPGEYALLTITDTGAGMDEETRKRAFEPFFTTKVEGVGTGLGLATVYGIVQQCGGWIDVASAPGQGARFTIGLPWIAAGAAAGPDPAESPDALRGSETVLVVEDQDEVRKLAAAVLKTHGYRVLEARNGGEALLIAERHPGNIHLMLTDVVMPGLTGKELADRLRPLRPDLRVLYMSGYADNVIAHGGVLDSGVEYISKPFTPESLTGKVRAVLGAPQCPGRILVVDDDAGIRTLFASVLTAAGYEVSSAADGDRALEVLGRQAADVVITDLVMPNREGVATIHAIRKRYPRLKIVVISGAFGRSLLKVSEMLAADATLVKPVSPDQLLAAVKGVMQRGSGRAT